METRRTVDSNAQRCNNQARSFNRGELFFFQDASGVNGLIKFQAMVKCDPQILSGKCKMLNIYAALQFLSNLVGVGIIKSFCLQHRFWGHLILFCLSGSGSWAQSFQQTSQDQVVYSQLHFDHTWCGSRVTTSFGPPLKTPQ